MSLAEIEKLDDQLAAWRTQVETGTELDDSSTQARSAVRAELADVVTRARIPGNKTDVVAREAAAATDALDRDTRELDRIRQTALVRGMMQASADRAAEREKRKERWRALSRAEQADFRAAEQRTVRAAFLAHAAALAAEDPGEPPATFEPEVIRVPGYVGPGDHPTFLG